MGYWPMVCLRAQPQRGPLVTILARVATILIDATFYTS